MNAQLQNLSVSTSATTANINPIVRKISIGIISHLHNGTRNRRGCVSVGVPRPDSVNMLILEI